MTAFWAVPAADLAVSLDSGPEGLSDAEASARLAAHGPNRLGARRQVGVLHELLGQFTHPIALILIAATVLSFFLGDHLDALIILGILALSGLLGFWQEHGAGVTVSRLLARVQVQVEVERSGRVVSIPSADIVPGDILVLNAGDIVPCDCRVVEAQALQLDESALTGESYPRHKTAERSAADAPMAERHSALFQGSHVVSGQGRALAVVTGEGTELGRMSERLAAAPPRTSFEIGSARFGLMLVRITALLTAAIFALNIVLDRPLIDALLFALALAVGVTPQMLPAIVSVSLSIGARRMARAQVIVRRLEAIEDLGSMDVLCTDKTGTLTQGRISLVSALGPDGDPSQAVGELAVVNAGLQTGFTNPLDEAILAVRHPDATWRAVAEVPFDFERKRLSVLSDGPEGRLLVTKGAFAHVLPVCTSVAAQDGEFPLDQARDGLEDTFRRLSAEGHRVLAVAARPLPDRADVCADDEQGLVFRGFLVFSDPPKPGLADTVTELAGQGVRLCIVTGDNHLATRHVARTIGLTDPQVLTGADVDALDDGELARATRTADAFAEVTPAQKERIIEAVRDSGAVVGYLGDGINDAGPLHLADVGISVDTAVDVAKSAAALVLLDKDLGVVVDGVRLGRQTFTNTMKYIHTTISANFGNIASMAIASAFLPFLPLLPRQILLLNFLSDLPSVTIAQDRVDEEDLQCPQQWDAREVRRFMVVFGLLSSVFDLLTFAVLLHVFHAGEVLFHTGWFIGSILTELAVLFVLRTRRLAFRSVPSRILVVTSVAVGLITVGLPFVPALAGPLGLTSPPVTLVLALLGMTAGYIIAAELTKVVFYRRRPPAVDAVNRPPDSGGTGGAVTGPADRRQLPAHHRRLQHAAREHGHHPGGPRT